MERIISRFADVQILDLAAVLPICWMLMRILSRRWQISLGGTALLLSTFAWWEHAAWHDHQTGTLLWPTVVHQMLITFPVVAGLLLWGNRLAQYFTTHTVRSKPYSRPAWCLAIAFALIPPAVYRVSRIQAVTAHLQELQSQSRIGELVDLGQTLLDVAPAMEHRHEPLRDVLARWESQQQQVIDKLPHVTSRLQQARLLAMLGLRREALMLLDIEKAPENEWGDVCLLAGTIYEHEHDWQRSLFWYEQARAKLLADSASPVTAVASACRGIGYCYRKQGRYREAEAAYLQLLELQPTAESHILLAQFYQDAQAGKRAAHHMDAAVATGGTQYAELARDMRFELQSRQFGCLQVWRQRASASSDKAGRP